MIFFSMGLTTFVVNDSINNMLFMMLQVFVGRFVSRKEREKELGEKAKLFTNVYVKNLPEDFNKDKLYDLFEPYGHITSHRVSI